VTGAVRWLPTVLKALWAVDAVILVLLLHDALGSKSDAAGRGMAASFAVLAGAPLFLSLGIRAFGSSTPVVAVATVVAAVPLALAALSAAQPLRDRRRVERENAPESWFEDSTMREMAGAIAAGDTARMRVLVVGGADPNGYDPFQKVTLLTFALRYAPSTIRSLVALGADPNFTAPGQMPPLAMALAMYPHHVGALLDLGADPNAAFAGGDPVIFHAIRESMRPQFQALVARGADVKALDGSGHTTLMMAVRHFRSEMALELLDRGVDPRFVAGDGESVESILSHHTLGESDRENGAYMALLRRLARAGIRVPGPGADSARARGGGSPER
jgi:hypothetical protein